VQTSARDAHRFFIWTSGCQMNKADGERLARELVAAGHTPVESLADATAVIVNGCAVRENSDRKVYGQLGLLRGLKRANPALIVALTGCTAHASPSELAPHLHAVDVVFDTLDPDPLMRRLGMQANDHAIRTGARGVRSIAFGTDPAHAPARPALFASDTGPVIDDIEALPLPGAGAVSRYVNAIYGCDKRCTYCIVPFRRGAQRSRPVGEVVDEVRRFRDEGAREVVLLGQIVNAYGQDLPGAPTLAGLLAAVDAVDGIERIRFTTAHPRYLTRDLAEAMRDLPKVCEELNLPVQAADNEVLRRMARGYSVEFYREKVDLLRATVPGLALSTDVIVGFCGETEAQFERTLAFVAETRFDQVHVAAFSPRGGTVAAGWPDDVAAQEKLRRLHAIERRQAQIAQELNARLVGAEVGVLLEELTPGKGATDAPRWRGRTRTNKLVFCPHGPGLARGQSVPLRVTEATPWSLRGEARAPVPA